MPSEDVIELSVEETNALRKELGLTPLRLGSSNKRAKDDDGFAVKNQTSDAQVLELSVDETNDLRKQLGLAPLRVDTADGETDGKSAHQALHKPAENAGDKKKLAERMERSKLEREVQRNIKDVFSETTLGEEDEATSTLSWAAKMRAQKQAKKKDPSKKKGKAPPSSLEAAYDERDLEGIEVSHTASDFEAGSTTILTLADAPLLKTQGELSSKAVGLNEDSHTLQNVELAEQQVQREGLRQKRKVELGMGRAGGYAGFDDDEFEELGGTQGPSRLARGQPQLGASEKAAKKTRGFKIGAAVDEEDHDKNDVFAFQQGKAVSLDPAKADVTATDFMTVEEDDALHKKSKKRKKDAKFKKKKKKEKRHRRKEIDSDEEAPSTGLLETLEQTAVGTVTTRRKRRRSDSEDETEKATTDASDLVEEAATTSEADNEAKKRAKFDQIMAKGNLRTAAAFSKNKTSSKAAPAVDMEEEPDDAFLSAALAKARRLRRLKEMSNATSNTSERGAEAVVRAVQNSRSQQIKEETNSGTMNFAVDETREFTRALRARAEQAERKEARKTQATSQDEGTKKDESEPTNVAEPTDEMEKDEEPADMMELAKEITEQDDDMQTGGFDGTTSNTVPVGRGLGNVLSMLRHTGEITGKHAGKEELRGRAKDERTYEDYESLDLSKVVRIGKGATEKDRELANREIKLEYRDEHGRLLTRKEAYRNLCYQFHGHSSSSKNEERRLQQIARERAEARLASRQVADDSSGGKVGGTLGALKATQRATGKAFVVHKT